MHSTLSPADRPLALGAMLILGLFSTSCAQGAPPPATTVATAATFKAPDITAQREAMTKLSFLHGTWNGIKKSRRPDGTMEISFSRDIIRPLLGGTLLSIEGATFAPGAATDSAPVSENYGIVRFNESRGTIEIEAFAMGSQMSGEGRIITSDHAEWVLHSPIGLVRFCVRGNGPDEWIETGDISTDGGKNWAQGFEIRFTRAD